MILLDGHVIDFKKFPNGETLIDGTQLANPNLISHIVLKFEDDSDLIKLMFIKRHLDEKGLGAYLSILYAPYSRMDRVEDDSVFTLKYVAEFINSLDFEKVIVYEPHSDVTPALLDRCVVEYPTRELVTKAISDVGFDVLTDYIYYPDAGAQKRYSKFFQCKTLVGYKERDFKTGHIKSLDVLGTVDKKDFKVIMVDDLCSKGGTFMLGAQKLKEMGAGELYLVVGHCENTIFDGDILKTNLLTKVFTTDSILTLFDYTKKIDVKIKLCKRGGRYGED